MSEIWVIKTSDGEEYPLRTDGVCFYDGTYESVYNLQKETEGHHGIPRTLLSDEIPEIAGAELRQIKEDIRTQYLPLRITGLNSADFHKNMAKLRKSLVNGEAQLWITNEEGDTRILYCNYKSGFDKAIDGSKRGRNWISVPLYLQANDPYFYDQPGVDTDNVYHQEPWTTKFLTKTVMYELKDAGSPYATDNTSGHSYLSFKEYPRGLVVGSPIEITSVDRTTPHRTPPKLAAERIEKRVFNTNIVEITDSFCQSCVNDKVTGIVIWWDTLTSNCVTMLAPYIALIASYGLDVWLEIEEVMHGHFTTSTTLAQYSSDTTVPGAQGVAWGTIMSNFNSDWRIVGFVFEGSYDIGVQFLRSVTSKTLTQCWLYGYGSYVAGGTWNNLSGPSLGLFNLGSGNARAYRLLNVDELLWEVYCPDESQHVAIALPFFKQNFPTLKFGIIGMVSATNYWEWWETYAYDNAHASDSPKPPPLSYDTIRSLFREKYGAIRNSVGSILDIGSIFTDASCYTPISEQLQNFDGVNFNINADPTAFDTTIYYIKNETGTYSTYNTSGQHNLSLQTLPDKLKVGDTITLAGNTFVETHVIASIPGVPTQYFVVLRDNLAHSYTQAGGAFVSHEGQQRDVSHESVYRETHTITAITNPGTGVYRAQIGTETLLHSHFEAALAYVSFSDPADHFLNPTPILETTLTATGTIGDATITIADTALCAEGDHVRIIDPIKNLYEENVIATVTDGNTLTLDAKIVNTYLLTNVPLVLVNRRVVNSDCVFVIYWLTGCPPCYRAITQLQALQTANPSVEIKYVEITHANATTNCHPSGINCIGMTPALATYPEGYAFAQACGPPLPALYNAIGTVMPAVITLYRSGIFIKGWCGVHTTNVDAVSDAILLDACGNRMKWRLNKTWIGYKVPIDNTGDAIAYPIWTLYGPGRTPRLTNVTTGKQLQLDHDLLEGEVVVVDSRDGAHTCGSNREGGEFIAGYTDSEPCPTCHGIGTIPSTCESCGGTEVCPSCKGTGIIDVWIPNSFGTTQLIGDMYNLRNELADTSQSFWGLAPSVNVVEMEMSSTNTTTSKIELQFQKKYEGI